MKLRINMITLGVQDLEMVTTQNIAHSQCGRRHVVRTYYGETNQTSFY